jgi:predicted PurR-regulated permease PerM
MVQRVVVMSSEKEPSSDAPLSDAERLEQLEKSSRLNRLILFVLAGVVLVIVLVTVIVQTVNLLHEDPADQTAEQIVELNKQLHSVQGDVESLQAKLQAQELQLTQLAQQKTGNLAGIMKPTQDPGTVEQLSKTLLGQEKDFQQVVLTLQVGMRDLAYMLPGSRTWLEYYTEALSKSLATSKLRSNDIQQWAKGQPPVAVVPLESPVKAAPVKVAPEAAAHAEPAKH